ncbi:MAG TPA: LuxR C-terminal-related transcriptional regulator, partial [Nakamurella sp.]
YLHAFDHLTVVRLLLAQFRATHDRGGLDRAAELLDRLADTAETSGRSGDLLEIRMLRAMTLDAGGDRPAALRTLTRAWANAPEPDGYARLFLDEGEPMLELLRAAARPADTGGRARLLLGLTGDREASGGPGQRPTGPSPAELSARERQVLRLLDSELTGPEIARELFVSQNTVRTHTKHIFTKLDVTNRRAAVRRARELGLM